MIYSYDLCGLPIQIESAENLPVSGVLERFRGAENANPAAVYRVRWYDGAPEITGQRVVDQWGYFITQEENGYTYCFNVGYTRNPHGILLQIDPQKAEYEFLLPKKHRQLLFQEGFDLAPILGQELLFIRNQRLIIHASFIRWNGRGILFTGPSGMGKSTQAGLWERYFDAKVLNGDKTVLHICPDQVTAWGSPYAGTSGIYRNESAPAAAIVSLRQGKENTIRRLRGREALMELMPRMATAPWAGPWHMNAMDLAIQLVQTIPVYQLTCRPDRDAAELTKQTIFAEADL